MSNIEKVNTLKTLRILITLTSLSTLPTRPTTIVSLISYLQQEIQYAILNTMHLQHLSLFNYVEVLTFWDHFTGEIKIRWIAIRSFWLENHPAQHPAGNKSNHDLRYELKCNIWQQSKFKS